MKVKRIIAYTLSVLVLLFSLVAILGIWDVVDIEYLIARMFKSLMVILAAAAVVVLIFSILDRPERPDRRDPEEG
ncbi:MAG: hypothetical protein K8R52_11935 [Bacteroidales bacterium]|nr:hypothetical protein [Bacteroidales bacterium]